MSANGRWDLIRPLKVNVFKKLLNPTDIYSAIKPLYCVSKMFG